MIKVTRFDGSQLYVNAELIEFIEATPDTIITLTNNRKLVVHEAATDVVEQIVAYKRRIHAGPTMRGTLASLPAQP